MSAIRSIDARHIAERFDPFQNPYLSDPYPFFAEARAATPVFYSPDLDYWVVTHISRSEEWPVMPVGYAGFQLKPAGFFVGSPALDVPPASHNGHCTR